MSKYNSFNKLKKISNSFINNLFRKYLNKLNLNLSISILIKKYLKKLNFKDVYYITKSNKFFLVFVALIVIFISYLSIPNIYDKVEIRKELKNQLLNNLSLNFNLTNDIRYSFFPRPHFIIKNSSIIKNETEISKIKELKIYVTLKNLFSLNDIKINDLILVNANFNLDNKNYNFFTKLLQKNLKDKSFKIKDSNIFYRNNKKEVLFINKIVNMHYYYDKKNFINTVSSKNEIFNIPYFLELSENIVDKKIFSKLIIKSLKLKIEDQIDYSNDQIKGSTNLILNRKQRSAIYKIKNGNFNFNFFDKLNNSNLFYKGEVNFKPFYSSFEGIDKEIDVSSIFNSRGLFSGLIKTSILNNRNLNVNLSINGDKIENYNNFVDISINSKIQEGLIDLDDTKFVWKNLANFKISNSLLYVRDNQLILDGKLDIFIDNSAEIYKSLLTPKRNRTKINKIDLNFNYNFDYKSLDLSDIKIDNELNQKLNMILKNLTFKNDKLQNKIYFKNKINKAIKAYSG
jgi:hypothetical protein